MQRANTKSGSSNSNSNSNTNSSSSTNGTSNTSSTNSRSMSTKDKIMSYASSASIVNIILIVIIMILIVIITVYIVKKLRQGDREESTLMTEDYLQLDDKTQVPRVIGSDMLPSAAQGNEYTYNFWLYLSDSYDSSAHHKILMYRGERQGGSATGDVIVSPGTSPIVVMDKNNNKLMIAVATSRVKSPMSINDIFHVKDRRDEKYMTSVIDYIPLQKWTNITIMIIDNMMRIYLDGDIYSVVSTNEIENTPSIVFGDSDLIVSHPNYNIKGHLAGLKFYNHSINHQKIRKIYASGPSQTRWLQYLGIQKYGVQSPIYKIE